MLGPWQPSLAAAPFGRDTQAMVAGNSAGERAFKLRARIFLSDKAPDFESDPGE
jgi:hypothetical protein